MLVLVHLLPRAPARAHPPPTEELRAAFASCRRLLLRTCAEPLRARSAAHAVTRVPRNLLPLKSPRLPPSRPTDGDPPRRTTGGAACVSNLKQEPTTSHAWAKEWYLRDVARRQSVDDAALGQFGPAPESPESGNFSATSGRGRTANA